MSNCYQPPLTPYGSTQYGGALTGGNYAPTKSPYFSIASQFLPRNLHDVIRWARYITLQSPVTTEVIRKLSTYPITEFAIDSEDPAVVKKYKDLIKSFKLKSSLYDVGFGYHTIGNEFISIYFPIQRMLKCPSCGLEHNAKQAEFASFKNYAFVGTCPGCNSSVEFQRKDTRSLNVADMNLIRWDPINIAVNHNPLTGEYEYWYRIPNEVKRRVQQGDKLFVNSVPWGVIEAVRKKQDYKFDNENIFHLRNVSTGAMVDGIAIPPLISQYHLVFYTATLRKANEAIANDFMAPMRVIYPTAQTGNSDPVVSMSMRNFVSNMQRNMIQFKQDSNHITIAPVPIGYQAISGEGKALLVSQEIAQAEESLLLSMGVSRELLSGTTNWTSSTVGLRMLDNTLRSYADQMNSLLEWVFQRVSKYLGLPYIPVTLTPFKLTDDESLRQVLLTSVQGGQASWSTLYESYGMDYQDELRKIREDAVAAEVNKVKTQIETERGVFLATKNLDQKLGQDDEYKTSLAKAQQMAEELSMSDPSTKRQFLGQLKIEDMAMYLMVSKLLEEINQANNEVLHVEQAQQTAAEQAGANVSPQGEAAPETAEAAAAGEDAATAPV